MVVFYLKRKQRTRRSALMLPLLLVVRQFIGPGAHLAFDVAKHVLSLLVVLERQCDLPAKADIACTDVILMAIYADVDIKTPVSDNCFADLADLLEFLLPALWTRNIHCRNEKAPYFCTQACSLFRFLHGDPIIVR